MEKHSDLAPQVSEQPDNHEAAVRRSKPQGQLERYIALKPIVAFGLTLQASWESVAVSFQSSMFNGGPVSLVYGMIIAGVGSCALAASLGEMASIDPRVGAQYRWSARYAPMRLSPLAWGFMQGWLTLLAWIAACAFTPFVLGTLIQAMVIFNYPDYDPKAWHATLLMWAFVALPLVWNFYARRLLVPLEIIGVIAHLIFFICTMCTLGILGPKSTHEFVWKTSVTGVSGWTNPTICFCIGLLSPTFSVSCFDGILHMSAETKDAHRRTPRSMFLAVLINTLFAFAFIICLLYRLGDINDVYAAPGGIGIIAVYYTATKSRAATNVLMSMIIIVSSIGNFGFFASVSRLIWSFARDGGLPFSETFSYVQPRLKIPTNALWLLSGCCILLSLVNLGSTTAFYACISLSTISLYISYLPPIFFVLLRKLRGAAPPVGPWHLGRFGVPINIFALVYAVFIIIWLPFPIFLPLDKDTMNYAAPVWIGCVMFALADYFISGHKRFKLPDEVGRADKLEQEDE